MHVFFVENNSIQRIKIRICFVDINGFQAFTALERALPHVLNFRWKMNGCQGNAIIESVATNKAYFLWTNCRLKTVDPRLPNWQIVYQTGTHGLEGAFYVTTATGKSIYLKLGQLIVEELGISITKE